MSDYAHQFNPGFGLDPRTVALVAAVVFITVEVLRRLNF